MQTEQAAREILKTLESLGRPVIIAIDGRCCAGKSTLAAEIAKQTDCNIFKTDDFYPPFSTRTEQQKANIDEKRFLEEVLLPLKEKREVLYRPYLCKSDSFAEPVKVPFKNISVIEGCYSLLAQLRRYYNLTLFVTIDAQEQQKRLLKREGPQKLKVFNSVWIKKEEDYFKYYNLPSDTEKILTLEG